jgi:hypothetical protein
MKIRHDGTQPNLLRKVQEKHAPDETCFLAMIFRQ